MNLLRIIKLSLTGYISSIEIALFPAISFTLLFIFSKLSMKINFILKNSLYLSLWTGCFIILSLITVSFFFSSLISYSNKIINKNKNILSSLKDAGKYFLKNLVIIVIILVSYNFIRFLAHYSALWIGRILSLSLPNAQILFFIIYFTGLLSLLTFLAFSSFYLIIKGKSVKSSIISSFALVKRKYPETLLIIIIFFVLAQLTSLIKFPFSEIINTLIILPILSLLLSYFVARENDI